MGYSKLWTMEEAFAVHLFILEERQLSGDAGQDRPLLQSPYLLPGIFQAHFSSVNLPLL